MFQNIVSSKRLTLVVTLGLGILAFAFIGLLLNNAQVGAQDPLDPGIDHIRMAMEPRPMADAELPIRVSVNYTHDIIEESYPSGHTIWITVTNAIGQVKATAEMTSGPIPGWPSGQTGFSTELNAPWAPGKPDIVPGDFVHATSDVGHTTTMQVGDIAAQIDRVSNIVTGTIGAPWLLPDDVEVKCKAYYIADPTDFRQVFDYDTNRSTLPDGEDVYTCNYGRIGRSLTPGQLLAVSYDPLEPVIRSNRTVAVFAIPGPHLQIKTSAPGAPGVLAQSDGATPGNVVLNIEYRNLGTQDATGVQIVNTLNGLTYLGDTSGASHTGSGTGPITWNIGTVPAGEHRRFQVFAAITVGLDALVTNNAQITSNPAENGGLNSERSHSWAALVQGNGAWLSVHQNAWTHNPTPDSELVYITKVCNTDHRYAVDSGVTTLTNLLPAGVTLEEWWGDSAWSELSRSDGQLVLAREAVAARGCTDVYLRAHLDADAEPGERFCSTAQVHTTNIANITSPARETTFCLTSSAPQPNLSAALTWAGGTLVPSGNVSYDIEVLNSGNTPLSGGILVTHTLPAAATFTGAAPHPDSQVTFNLTPVHHTADQLVWEIPQIAAGASARFSISFDLDESIDVGTALVNTVEVGLPALEEDTGDNIASWSETIQDRGPNLRVITTAEWADRGARTDRINYQLMVENVGDVGVYNVRVTDTYDDRTTRPTVVSIDRWTGASAVYDAAAHTFHVDIDLLGPGERFAIDFAAVAATRPVAPGLTFLNSATVTPSHTATAPDANSTAVSISSGPDLAIAKRYEEGETVIGQLVTYLLTYHNALPARHWWWGLQGNGILTDILPDGLEFVSAERWQCGADTWCAAPPDSIDGQTVTWDLGKCMAGEVNVLRVTARIKSTVPDQTQLTNRATIASSNSTYDIEANEDNNQDAATITVSAFSNGIYTLDITKVGQGDVIADPDRDLYTEGESVTLSPIPATGWRFARWSGDNTSSDDPLILTMSGDTTLIATFEPLTYTLEVITAGEGTVDRDPDQETYHHGDVVTLTTVPATGWAFTGWSGAVTGSDDPLILTMSGNTTLIATFKPLTYTLEVTTMGEGTVDRDPERETYHYGDVVTLTAVPATGWAFTGWSGDVTGSETRAPVTMITDTAVTAAFTETRLTLTKTVTPDQEIEPDSVITYTIILSNTGEPDLEGLVLTDPLPQEVVFGGFTGATDITPLPDVSANTLTWAGTLPVGAQHIIIFTATVSTDSDLVFATITNRVEIAIHGNGIAAAEASFKGPRGYFYLPLIFREYLP